MKTTLQHLLILLTCMTVSVLVGADLPSRDANPLVGVWLRYKQENWDVNGTYQIFAVRRDGTAVLAWTSPEKATFDSPYPYQINTQTRVLTFKGIDFSYEVRSVDKGRIRLLTLTTTRDDGVVAVQNYRLITAYLEAPASNVPEDTTRGLADPRA